MRIIDILTAPWAITPDKLTEITAIYDRHLRGDKIDLDVLRAETGLALDNRQKGYQVHDGVALIEADGVIAKRMNLFSRISGGVSTELLGRELAAALADPKVQAIVLAMDSPGGTVDGTPELAQQVLRARAVKPLVCHSDGTLCSAAYWIGSAANRVLISSEVVTSGSIGVVAQHIDYSEAERRRGVVTTEITAGRYKRIASQYAPLSEAGRATIQEMVDYVYSVFVDAVADQRGVDAGEVLERMADGRVFHGSQAIEAGLVDGVATLAEAIEQARALARETNQRRAGGAKASQQTSKEQPMLTIETLKTEHADLVAQIEAEAREGLLTADQAAEQAAAARDQALIDGAAAERQRIADVRAQLIPGHETLIEQLAMDGTTTGPQAAIAIIEAERAARAKQAAAGDAESNPVVPPARPEDGQPQTMKRAAFDLLGHEERRAFMRAGGKIVD